jgi:YVTN family beta-propeller protein
MKLTPRAVTLIAVVLAGLATTANFIAPAASAASGRSTVQAATSCIKVTATIPVGSFPEGVAANPKTNTAYVTNRFSNTVSVISGRTNTVTATIPSASSHPRSRRTRRPTPLT